MVGWHFVTETKERALMEAMKGGSRLFLHMRSAALQPHSLLHIQFCANNTYRFVEISNVL